MNRTRLVFLAGGLLLATNVAACGSTAADRGASGIPAAPSPTAAASANPPSPTPETRTWGAGGAVSFPYGSFAEWARGTGDVALVRIVDVSKTRWSTASGEGPSPADIDRANRGEAYFTIGRLVTVELVRMLRGAWPAAGPTALFWLPGGRIGNDQSAPLDFWAGLDPRPGSPAVAGMVFGADFDPTDGVLWMNVSDLFPAAASGRLWTYNPQETIMIGDVERYLPAP